MTVVKQPLPITTRDSERDSAYADILSQAIIGELVGMENFAALAQIVATPEEKLAAVEHANNERKHALAFMKAARELKLEVTVDLGARYWGRLREIFQRYVARRDRIACYLAQEVMLESLALGTYRSVSERVEPPLADIFRQIAGDEEAHLSHCLEELRLEAERAPDVFEQTVYQIHSEFMTTIAEMMAREDASGHCGICHGACVKTKLRSVNLDLATMRGRTIEVYLSTLDRLGLPGDKTLRWTCELPA